MLLAAITTKRKLLEKIINKVANKLKFRRNVIAFKNNKKQEIVE